MFALGSQKTLMMRSGSLFLAAICLLMFGFLHSSQAQTATFAQFSQTAAGQDFVFTNNNQAQGAATFATVANGTPVTFDYSNIANLPSNSELNGPQAARVFVSGSTTQTVSIFGNRIFQGFNQTFTIQVIRDTPASVGRGTRRNLLTATITTNTDSPELSGRSGFGSATFDASTPNNIVTFTSDFLRFGNTTDRNLGLSFSSVNPTLSVSGINNLLNSFTTAGTGTFASNPAPVFNVTTAAGVSISGRVFNASGGGLSNARVTLTTADGTARTVLTNAFGYYGFENIPAGQTVLLNVASKRYYFAPRTVSALSDTPNFDFVPE